MKPLSLCVLCLAAAGLAPAQDLDRGIGQYRKNDFGGAASTLKKVVDSEQDNAQANLYLGLALVEQGKVAEAEPYINRADELAPGADSKAGKARLAVAKKDLDGADQALSQADDAADAVYVRGLLELERKQYPDAARDFEQYIESRPEHAYAHYYAGMAYNGMRRPDKMLTHFQIFVKMKPDAPEARKVQAVLNSGR